MVAGEFSVPLFFLTDKMKEEEIGACEDIPLGEIGRHASFAIYQNDQCWYITFSVSHFRYKRFEAG